MCQFKLVHLIEFWAIRMPSIVIGRLDRLPGHRISARSNCDAFAFVVEHKHLSHLSPYELYISFSTSFKKVHFEVLLCHKIAIVLRESSFWTSRKLLSVRWQPYHKWLYLDKSCCKIQIPIDFLFPENCAYASATVCVV